MKKKRKTKKRPGKVIPSLLLANHLIIMTYYYNLCCSLKLPNCDHMRNEMVALDMFDIGSHW